MVLYAKMESYNDSIKNYSKAIKLKPKYYTNEYRSNSAIVPLETSSEKLPIDNEQTKIIKSQGLISKNKFISTIS